MKSLDVKGDLYKHVLSALSELETLKQAPKHSKHLFLLSTLMVAIQTLTKPVASTGSRPGTLEYKRRDLKPPSPTLSRFSGLVLCLSE